jgi:hypothetical protein
MLKPDANRLIKPGHRLVHPEVNDQPTEQPTQKCTHQDHHGNCLQRGTPIKDHQPNRERAENHHPLDSQVHHT